MKKPTVAMREAAKKGLEMHANNKGSEITPRALEVGRKIASGQDLSAEHITDMAHFHASHDVCPKDAEDLLWGGPAGEIWARSKIMQSLNTGFADDFRALMKDNKDLSFEIFSDINLDEPVQLGEDENGYIWAPILRSGTLATRPGLNGQKLDEPLVFVPGHSTDQYKEIGLQDIVDSFNDGAIEHVTIPLSHRNELLENTGYIRKLKIVDSKKHPGQKVLLAAHEFTEPEIKRKIERGTIPSRSSGILYDYKNTTTGKVYPVALEHTALTHKPWVGGLTSYGELNTDVFSDDRLVVPMMLSESGEIASLREETRIESVRVKGHERESDDSTYLADVQWGEDLSYHDIEKQISEILSKMSGGTEDSYPIYFPIDIKDGKALIKVNYGVGNDEDAWVVPFTVDKKTKLVQLSPFADWIDVQRKWVSDTTDPALDKSALDKLGMAEGIDLAVLKTKERDALKDSDFAIPEKRSYPIENIAHARDALSRVSADGSPDEQKRVREAVYRRYPELKKNREERSGTNMSSDPLTAASEARSARAKSTSLEGGPMKLLTMSEDEMERLGLSDEAKELQRRQNAQMEDLNKELLKTRAESRVKHVEQYIAKLASEGLEEHAGLLSEIQATLLSDDGNIALNLQLSEHGVTRTVAETATDIVERIVKALPRKDGKIAFSDHGSILTSPVSGRPPLKQPGAGQKERQNMTGDELMAELLSDAPEVRAEFEGAGVKLSEKGQA